MSKQPIEARCDRSYRATKTSGRRDPDTVLWIVIHSEEAASALSAARYFALPEAKGSAHLCVDDTICYRTLDNRDIPWAAPGANTKGFHIEQAGFARWQGVEWMQHRDTLKRAAYKTALHCDLFGIPVVFRMAAALKAGEPGVTTHAECSKAFGGDHTDPGRFWPRRWFMRQVLAYYRSFNT